MKANDSNIPQIKTRTIIFEKTPEDTIKTMQCSDFPFKLGCNNPKIGDFNATVFMGNRFNNTYTTRVQKHLNGLSWFTDENPNKELTQEIWYVFMKKPQL